MGLITGGLLGGLLTGGLGARAGSTVPAVPPPRDADVIDAIIASLRATRAFDEVAWGEAPEKWGRAADRSALATVEPADWKEIDEWDEEPAGDSLGYAVRSTFLLTIYVRNPDNRTRDRRVDRLLNIAKVAIDGQGFGGIVVPDLTILRSGKYQPAASPERRMTVVGEYCYLVDGSESHDTDA